MSVSSIESVSVFFEALYQCGCIFSVHFGQCTPYKGQWHGTDLRLANAAAGGQDDFCASLCSKFVFMFFFTKVAVSLCECRYRLPLIPVKHFEVGMT